MTTPELVVVNQQEAKLLDLQAQIEKLTFEADNTAKTIENLKSAKCSYKDLATCEEMLVFEDDNTEPAPNPKAPGVPLK